MTIYKNLSGDSGVVAYEVYDDSIDVQFKGTGNYGYKVADCGRFTIDQMKSLAQTGRGLQTFINKNKPKFYKKG